MGSWDWKDAGIHSTSEGWARPQKPQCRGPGTKLLTSLLAVQSVSDFATRRTAARQASLSSSQEFADWPTWCQLPT